MIGTNVLGEVKNEGPDAAGAEIIVLIRSGDVIAGGGSAVVDCLNAGEKKSFSVPISGSTQGTMSIEVSPRH